MLWTNQNGQIVDQSKRLILWTNQNALKYVPSFKSAFKPCAECISANAKLRVPERSVLLGTDVIPISVELRILHYLRHRDRWGMRLVSPRFDGQLKLVSDALG